MSIEMERVSEGQRFVTKLMTEGAAQPLALGAGGAEAIPIRDRDAVRVANARP
jgi:hypothetical protein